MKRIIIAAILIMSISCVKEKVLQLPEISHSNVTDIQDVSAAYLFYDETLVDSVELNRKNLISSTNWLVNVDKRLTLNQVIPHLKFLQEKKGNAGHKNKNAKNYFTCNNTSINSLGFIDFTDIIYHVESSEKYISKIPELKYADHIKAISFNLNGEISILNPSSNAVIINTSKDDLLDQLKKVDSLKNIIYLNFNEKLLFQDYITYKTILLENDLKHAKISNHEFLHF